MLGRQDRSQRSLLVPGSIDDFIPEDHILKRVDRVLDLSWLRDEVKDNYCLDNGRPGIDPESAVRLMLAGFFHGIVHDRKLMREAQVNLAIRWFAGYSLTEDLPDHSTLTRIRQRWGAERFRRIFIKTVKACAEAGLVTGETIHADATLIRADVSWESLTTDYADESFSANNDGDEDGGDSGGRPGGKKPRKKKKKKPKKRSSTDPDATMTTSRSTCRMEPSYKQHTSVDDHAGVIVDVDVTTGEVSEGGKLLEAVDRIEEVTGKETRRITADAGYSHPTNYQALEERSIDPIIPPQKTGRRKNKMPVFLFKYDSYHDIVCCPAGKKLRRSSRVQNGYVYCGKTRDCTRCRSQPQCVPRSGKVRKILIVDGYPALLKARRRRKNWDEETRNWYSRHRWRVEGVHGEAKTQHGLRRAVRRGLDNVAIQAYLTAAAMNLKRLAAFLRPYFAWLLTIITNMKQSDWKMRVKINFPIDRNKKRTGIIWAT
jgi:transposase